MPGQHEPRRKERIGKFCHGCQQRLYIGEPRHTDTWPQRLALSRAQLNVLLEAAAEYAELCEEAGEYEEAVAFLDWVTVDALRNAA